MKNRQLLVLAALAACPSIAALAEEPAADANTSIRAFIEICVKQAPSFAGAANAAKAFGIAELSEFDGEKSGMTDDRSLTVQVKDNQACTVTTDVQKDRKLTQQLLEAVARQSGGKPARRVPAGVVLGGVQFVLTHDREGGEAFVLVKAK